MMQSMGLQRVGRDLRTEQQQQMGMVGRMYISRMVEGMGGPLIMQVQLLGLLAFTSS